jgi:hypothetical protein
MTDKGVFSNAGFEKKDWQPPNLRIFHRDGWNAVWLLRPLSGLTYVYDFKRTRHKV